MATNDVAAIRALTQDEWDELNRAALLRQSRAQSMRPAQNFPNAPVGAAAEAVAEPGAKQATDGPSQPVAGESHGSGRHLSLVSNDNSGAQSAADLSPQVSKELSWAEPVDWSDCVERDVR